MEIMLQLLDELDDAAGIVRLTAPGLLTALAGLVIAAMITVVWFWFPEFTLAALAAGATIFGAVVAVRVVLVRHSRGPGPTLSA
jgi:hypothetical protein